MSRSPTSTSSPSISRSLRPATCFYTSSLGPQGSSIHARLFGYFTVHLKVLRQRGTTTPSAGRSVQEADKPNGLIFFSSCLRFITRYPHEVSEEHATGLLQVVRIPRGTLQQGARYQHLQDTLWPLAIPSASDCIGRKEQRLFRVAVLIDGAEEGQGEGGTFGVLVSLNHVLGDASTLYQINGMLSPGAEAEPLVAAREQRIQAESATLLGAASQSWASSPAAAFAARMSLAARSSFPGEFILKTIPKPAIDSAKLKVGGSPGSGALPWVSTNDILASWFCRLCRPGWALVCVDLRRRLRGLGSMHAGNYLGNLVLGPSNYESASAVRKAVNNPSTVRPLRRLRTPQAP